jgi:ABC-type sugar transport system substrate-binding protein
MEQIMKRKRMILALVLVVAMVFVFAACGNSGNANEKTSETGADAATSETPADSETAGDAGKTLKFGEIAHDKNLEWVNYGVQNFEYACQQLGVEPVVVDAQNDMEKVISGMEDLLAKGVDAVSVYSFSPDLDKRVAEMAREAGIPIIFENAIPADEVDRDSVTCCTYDDIGEAAANMIADQYPGSKFVYIMGQPGMNITEPYLEGIQRALDAGANTKMVDTAPTNWTAEEGLNAAQNIIQSGVEFDVIFANNEQIAQGVIKALKDANKEVPVIATGGSPQGIEMLENEELAGTLAAPVSFMGMMSAKKLYALVNGGEVEPMTYVPLLPATKANVGDVVPWTPEQKVIDAVGGLEK